MKLILAMALAVVACTGDDEREIEPYRLWVSPQFSATQRVAVERACGRWNEVAGRTAIIVDGIGDRDRMVVRPARYPIDGIDAQGFHAEHGVLLIADKLVCASGETEADIRCFEANVIHETGHVMGVPHVSHGIMQEWNVELELSDEDRAACKAATYCGGLTSPKR